MQFNNNELMYRDAVTIEESAIILRLPVGAIEDMIFAGTISTCFRFIWKERELALQGYFEGSIWPDLCETNFKVGKLTRILQQDAASILLNGKTQANWIQEEPRMPDDGHRTKCLSWAYCLPQMDGATITREMLLISRAELLYWIEKGFFQHLEHKEKTNSKTTEGPQDWEIRAREIALAKCEEHLFSRPGNKRPTNTALSKIIEPILKKEGFTKQRGGGPLNAESIRKALNGLLK